MESKKVIDVSKWNVIKDYSKIKADGVNGAIVKVINSANNIDSSFFKHINGCREAGLEVIGGYNYLYANTTEKADKTAKEFYRLCNQNDIPCGWLDIEDVCMKNLGSKIVKIIDIYKYYAGYYNVKLGIYTGVYFYNNYIKKYINHIGNVPFWFAKYPYNSKEFIVTDNVPTMKNFPQGVTIEGWQYTSKCKINGASGYIDLSAWYDDKAFKFVDVSQKIYDIRVNPYTEPTANVSKFTRNANDINWVKYNLWLQGFYCDNYGNPKEYTEVCDGLLNDVDIAKIKLSQKALGLVDDGIVGKVTKSVWKKIVVV